jgi:hypothetical protein
VVEQRSTLLHPMISMGSDISFFEEVLKLQPLALNTQNSAGETLLFSAVSVLVQFSDFVGLIFLFAGVADSVVYVGAKAGNEEFEVFFPLRKLDRIFRCSIL